MSESKQLLTIIINADIQDMLVDWFLERGELDFFNSYEIKSYKKDHSGYSVIEKVTGWKRKVAMTTILHVSIITTLVKDLEVHFAGSQIVYTITPVVEEGII